MNSRRNSQEVKVSPIAVNTEKNAQAASENDLSNNSLQPRSIDLKGGVMMIVSLMIGSGIFTFAGEIHSHVNSVGLAMCIWLLAGGLGLTGALCYAELGTAVPGSGGEAQYLNRGFGPLSTYLFDWTSILILKPGTVAIMFRAFSQYGIELVKVLTGSSYFNDKAVLNGWITASACAGCVLVTALSAYSQRWSNRILDALTWSKVCALGMIIGGGIIFCVRDSSIFYNNVISAPFSPTDPKVDIFKSYSGLMGKLVLALCSGLWGFEGWNNLNIVSGDLKNPKRNLPLAIWISVGSVLGLYLATLLAYYCVIPGVEFMKTEAVGLHFGSAVVKELFGPKWTWIGAALLSVAIMGSTFSASLSSMLTSSEIIVLSSENGNIPALFGHIDIKTGTAFNAYLMQGLLSIVLILVFSDNLVTLYTFPTWIFYAMCTIVLLKLRVTEPEIERPYRVLLSTPILFLIACALLTLGLCIEKIWQVVVSVAVILLGVPVYYLYTSTFRMEKKQKQKVSN